MGSDSGNLEIPWENSICILCLEPANFSFERIIPASLGGKLGCKFLCTKCNSKMGSGFEANARKAPEIRIAAANLKSELPDLFQSIERRQKYHAKIDGQVLVSKLDSKGVLTEGQLADGSLVVSEERAWDHLARQLDRSGSNDDERRQALQAWSDAKPGKVVQMNSNKSVRKWEGVWARPHFDEPALSNLVPLKIIYEFMVLSFGKPILEARPALSRLRAVLLEEDQQTADEWVEHLVSESYAPFHGICFEGNRPSATFQVRLFGKLAYRVTVPGLSIDSQSVNYTQKLATGEHTIQRR